MMGGVESKLRGTPEKPGKPSTIKNAEEVHAHILHIVSNMIPSASNRGDTITRKATDLQHYVKESLIPLLKKASKAVGIAPLSATSSAASASSSAPLRMPYRPTEPLSRSVPAYPPPRPTTASSAASSVISAQLQQLKQESGQQGAPVGKPPLSTRLGDISASAAAAAFRAGPRPENIMSNASPPRVRPSSAVPAAAFGQTATTRSFIRPSTALPTDAAVAPILNTRPLTQYHTFFRKGGYHLTRRRSKKRNRSTRRRTPRKHKARRR